MTLGESMLLTLKNNKDLKRIKKKLFEPFIRKKQDNDDSLYNLPKATPELLEKIRVKKELDHKEETIKTLVSVIIVLIMLIVILL